MQLDLQQIIANALPMCSKLLKQLFAKFITERFRVRSNLGKRKISNDAIHKQTILFSSCDDTVFLGIFSLQYFSCVFFVVVDFVLCTEHCSHTVSAFTYTDIIVAY